MEQQDPAAWNTLTSIYAWNVDCVIVASKSHGEAIVVFREALGRSVIARDSAIYAIDRRGKGQRNPPTKHLLRTLYDLALIPLVAAIVAIPVWEFMLHNADLTLPVPVPAVVVAFAVGLVAFVLTRRKYD